MKKFNVLFAVVLFVIISFSQKVSAQTAAYHAQVTKYATVVSGVQAEIKKEGKECYIKVSSPSIKYIRIFRPDGSFVNRYSLKPNSEWTSIHYLTGYKYFFDEDYPILPQNLAGAKK